MFLKQTVTAMCFVRFAETLDKSLCGVAGTLFPWLHLNRNRWLKVFHGGRMSTT